MICYAQMPLIVPNFILLSQTMYEKSVTIFFYTLQYFGDPGGPPGLKFTDLGPDVQQGPSIAKFRPVLKTRLRDICCQISSISLTAWPSDMSPHA